MTNKTKALITTAGLALLATGGSAQAAPPSPHQLSIAAKPARVVYGGTVAITGKLTGSDNAGETINLNEDPFPFGTFTKLATTQTSAAGSYGFFVTPTVNTKYQTDAKSKAPATSPQLLVKVAPKITLKVSDKTPAVGQKVTFSGTVAPDHDGQSVLLQRYRNDGTWRTIKTLVLVDAGTASSKFAYTRKITRTGTFRIKKSADTDHVAGHSHRRTLTVHSS
jgi:hypothetical protein